MKTRATLYAAVLVAFATVSGAALAADDTAAAAKPATTDTAKSAPLGQQPPAAKKAKPHSHVQEKVGVAPAAATPAVEPDKASMDKMHQHPRDGK